MATDKQIAANKKNSLSSTGPRTAAGKLRSSQNSIKHGGYSQQLGCLTPDERNPDFRRFLAMYLAHYRPKTEFHKYQVIKLAVVDWRLNRFPRMEAEILTAHGFEIDSSSFDQQLHYAGAGWAFTHDATKSKSMALLSQVEDRADRRFRALQKQVDKSLSSVEQGGELSPGPKVPATDALK